MKHRIEIWKEMVKTGSPDAQDYLATITLQAQKEGKIDQMNEAAEFLLRSASSTLSSIENEIAEYTLHQKMGSLTEIINLAYIARHYFGKTRQWLYQRLKGQIINGKRARFTPEEEQVFYHALNEIGMQISDLTSHSHSA